MLRVNLKPIFFSFVFTFLITLIVSYLSLAIIVFEFAFFYSGKVDQAPILNSILFIGDEMSISSPFLLIHLVIVGIINLFLIKRLMIKFMDKLVILVGIAGIFVALLVFYSRLSLFKF